MTDAQQISKPVTSKKNKGVLLVLILPLVSCSLSSIVGIVLGQVGNMIYKVLGEAATCLTIPGFISLFLITFGISFMSNKLLRKWLSGSGK